MQSRHSSCPSKQGTWACQNEGLGTSGPWRGGEPRGTSDSLVDGEAGPSSKWPWPCAFLLVPWRHACLNPPWTQMSVPPRSLGVGRASSDLDIIYCGIQALRSRPKPPGPRSKGQDRRRRAGAWARQRRTIALLVVFSRPGMASATL